MNLIFNSVVYNMVSSSVLQILLYIMYCVMYCTCAIMQFKIDQKETEVEIQSTKPED